MNGRNAKLSKTGSSHNLTKGSNVQKSPTPDPHMIASQQIDEIKNLYRNFKNLSQAGSLDDGYEHSLSQPILPTIKVQEVHKTTTTILPPLPHHSRNSPVPSMASASRLSFSINKPQITNQVTTINGNTTMIYSSSPEP